jgi:hypothetical protein
MIERTDIRIVAGFIVDASSVESPSGLEAGLGEGAVTFEAGAGAGEAGAGLASQQAPEAVKSLAAQAMPAQLGVPEASTLPAAHVDPPVFPAAQVSCVVQHQALSVVAHELPAHFLDVSRVVPASQLPTLASQVAPAFAEQHHALSVVSHGVPAHFLDVSRMVPASQVPTLLSQAAPLLAAQHQALSVVSHGSPAHFLLVSSVVPASQVPTLLSQAAPLLAAQQVSWSLPLVKSQDAAAHAVSDAPLFALKPFGQLAAPHFSFSVTPDAVKAPMSPSTRVYAIAG